MDSRTKQLGEAPILPMLVKYSLTAMIGMVAHSLYNVVDRIFIGHKVGSIGIAGITIAFPLMMVMFGFAMLVGMGGAALISIKLGEKKPEEAEKVLGNGIVLQFIFTIILMILGLIFLRPLLRLSGASDTVMPYAVEYARIILFGAVFQSAAFCLNWFIRSQGKIHVATMTMVIGAVANMILDPIFIFVFEMGVRGAAIATVLGTIISTAWVLYYFMSGRSQLKIRVTNFRLEWPIVQRILAVGSPSFAMQIAASLLHSIMNSQLRTYGGDIAISAIGIIFSIIMLILMPIFGICQAAQPIIGYNFGARQFDRVKHTLLLAIIKATVICGLGFLVIMLFPDQIIRLFNRKDTELIALGSRAMRLYLCMTPIIGFQIISSIYFQAVGKARIALFMTLSRQVILLIPLLLILPHYFGLDGVWYTGPLSDFGSSLLTGTWLLLELRKLDVQHAETQQELPVE